MRLGLDDPSAAHNLAITCISVKAGTRLTVGVSGLVRVRLRLRLRLRGRVRGRVRLRAKVRVGVKVRVGSGSGIRA